MPQKQQLHRCAKVIPGSALNQIPAITIYRTWIWDGHIHHRLLGDAEWATSTLSQRFRMPAEMNLGSGFGMVETH